ncbi:MAG: DNA polymerase III subunit delta [Candidatus Zixiibacteriota bacterium]
MAKDQLSKLKFEDLYARIDKGSVDPIYFLNGSEEYLKVEFLKLLRLKLFGDKKATANVEKISAAAGSAPAIIDLTSDYSLFSGGRLVVVYDIQRISKAGQEMLLSYFPTIPDGNHLVLFGPASFDMRTKFYKYLTQNATWSSLSALSERSAPFWIKRRISKYGLKIEQPALEQLLRYVGNSYGLLANQIDKLVIAAGDKQTIDVADIDKHTAVAAEFEVFKLLELVDSRDRTRALQVLTRLLEKSDGIRSVLFWLSERFFQYYFISSNHRHLSDGDMAASLHMSPYILKRMMDLVQKVPSEHFEKSIRAITQAEVSLRFASLPSRLVLENLIISLTGRD